MLNSYYFAAIVAYFTSYTSAASNVCSSSPYASLSCLKNNSAAASACSSQQSTAPARVAVAAADATVTVTNTHTSIVLVTTSSFAYTVSTSTIMATTTKTTYVASTTAPARRLRARASACTASKALMNLSSMSGANLATACSCIGISTASTSPIADVKVAAGTPSTTTVQAGLTLTSYINAGATQFAQKVTSTITTTLSLAAPTYSHVYAAAAGCQDTPTVDTLQLDPSVTEKDTAISQCQASCNQNGKCASLFVQFLFPEYESTAPVYKCFMNGQSFVESSSLVCGLSEKIWGVADAYDAVGRGVPY